MPRWLPAILERVTQLAAAGRVRLTLKAFQELAMLDLPLDEQDVRSILIGLTPSDSGGRVVSDVTGEWLYVFLPTVGGERLYVKVLLRTDCVVVSFHGQVDDEEDDDG